MKTPEFKSVSKKALEILSNIDFGNFLQANSGLVIKSFLDDQTLGLLAKLYRAHLKFHREGGFDDLPDISPFRIRPYPPDAFIENMVRAFSCPVDREPRPPSEWNNEHIAQINRVKRLIGITKRSEYLSFEIAVSDLLYSKYVIGEGMDPTLYPDFDLYLRSIKTLGSLNDILDLYVEYLEHTPDYEKPVTRDKFSLIVHVTTRRLFELTGNSKYSAAINLINQIHGCNKSEKFAKKHRYIKT